MVLSASWFPVPISAGDQHRALPNPAEALNLPYEMCESHSRIQIKFPTAGRRFASRTAMVVGSLVRSAAVESSKR